MRRRRDPPLRSVAERDRALTAATAQPIDPPPAGLDADGIAAFWLTLDAINFGSGWFPTLRKRDGLSGYNTIALAWREHQQAHGPLTPEQLTCLDAADGRARSSARTLTTS